MDKYEISQILKEIGILIEIVDENPLKGLSYRKAARSLESVENLEKIIADKALDSLPGIGEKIAKLIYVLYKKGTLSYYEELKKKVPESLYEIMNIPGISMQKVRILYQKLKIKKLRELSRLLKKKDVRIPGFSPYFLKKMEKRIESIQKEGISLLWEDAMDLANSIEQKLLLQNPEKLEITGSLRRKNELIYAIEFVALSSGDLIQTFISHPVVLKVLKQTKSSVKVRLKKGPLAILHIATQRSYPFLLLHTTGSKEHIKELKKRALTKHLNLTKNSFKPSKKTSSEEELYHHLGLPFIVPELRETGEEVEIAKTGKLPHLIEEKDLQGTFHCHTIDSDGANTLEELVFGAQALGWSYLGISDHSKSLKIAKGMSEEKLYNQIEKIRKLNQKFKGSFHIFSGVECDILKDGTLDYSDDLLSELDFVIISIHSHFKMDKKEMTKRIIKAIEHPSSTILGHISGRLLRYRDPYLIDIDQIIDACSHNHKIIELNAYPNRMDMDWRYWKRAKEKNVKCSINPDAHSVRGLSACSFGVSLARKGWLEKKM